MQRERADVYARCEYHILEASAALAAQQRARLSHHSAVVRVTVADARDAAAWHGLRDKVRVMVWSRMQNSVCPRVRSLHAGAMWLHHR